MYTVCRGTVCNSELIEKSNIVEKNKKITPIFLSNKISSTLIIPIELARKFELDRPSNVVLEATEKGILIKKVRIEDD